MSISIFIAVLVALTVIVPQNISFAFSTDCSHFEHSSKIDIIVNDSKHVCMIEMLTQEECKSLVTASSVRLETFTGFIDVKKYGRFNYTNVTIFYENDNLIRPVVLYETGTNGFCWKISLSPRWKGPVHVYHLETAKALNIGQLPHDKECVLLMRGNLSFTSKPPTERRKQSSLLLIYKSETKLSLQYELHHALCNISCDGEAQNQCHVNSTEGNLKSNRQVINEFEITKHELELPNKSSGFYCMRIGPDDCPIHTNTIHHSNNIGIIVVHNFNIKNDDLFIYRGVILLATAFTVCVVGLAAYNSYYRNRREIINTRDDDPALATLSTTKLHPNETSVLLVYHYSEHLQRLMQAFTHLLAANNITVWNPFFEDEAIAGQNNWIQTALESPNIKILLIENSDAVRAKEMWSKNHSPDTFHENVFNEILDILYNSKQTHSKLFIFRVESHCELPNLHPKIRYFIQEDSNKTKFVLHTLIRNIRGKMSPQNGFWSNILRWVCQNLSRISSCCSRHIGCTCQNDDLLETTIELDNFLTALLDYRQIIVNNQN